LIAALEFCHKNNVNLYVTVNNLYFESELDPLSQYLTFLAGIGVDALIVQDPAVIKMCRDLKLNLPLHASVQMGVDNLETAQWLYERGVKRAILSKNLDLEEIAGIHRMSELEIEYFVHGDLCIAHTGQCWLSGLIFNENGNRGRCRKPCRWPYRLQGPKPERYEGEQYFLAHNDLCLYQHIPELIEAGVSSFKIEGRMRGPEYIGMLVSIYRKAIDRFIQGQNDPDTEERDRKTLHQQRIRDFTSASLFGPPGPAEIGYSGLREPRFPTAPVRIETWKAEDYREQPVGDGPELELSVKVGGFSGLDIALEQGVKTVIIPASLMRGSLQGFTSQRDVATAIERTRGAGAKAVLELPRIVSFKDRPEAREWLALAADRQADAVIAHDLGTLSTVAEKKLDAWAGAGINLANSMALHMVAATGARAATASPELRYPDLKAMAGNSPLPLEVIVHGPVCGMVTDYCLGAAVNGGREACAATCLRADFQLVDEWGQAYPVASDYQCRSYIYHPMDLSIFPVLPRMKMPGIHWLRIEGDRYAADILAKTISLYQSAISDLNRGTWRQAANWRSLNALYPGGLYGGPICSSSLAEEPA
jgi:putative protease